MKIATKKVKSNHMKHKQVGTQDDSYAQAQLQGVASCLKKAKPSTKVAFEHIKCVSSIVPQKLYQSHALEIAEEYEQAIDANSLEKINKLLDKVLEPGSGSGKRQWVVSTRRAPRTTKKTKLNKPEK